MDISYRGVGLILGAVALALLAPRTTAIASPAGVQRTSAVVAESGGADTNASPSATDAGTGSTGTGGAAGAFANAGTGAEPAARPTRLLVLGICAGALLVIAAVLLSGQLKLLIVGEDNRYSNSKFQMALWFSVLIVSYTAALWLRWWKGDHEIGGVGIQPYLLALSGASAFTLGAAKGITTNKQATAIQSGTIGKVKALTPQFPYDLFHNDNGQVDFGDFQMFFITLIAAAVYLLQVFHFLGTPLVGDATTHILSLPEVDSTLLAAFGLGQGAYLVKKYAGNPGES